MCLGTSLYGVFGFMIQVYAPGVFCLKQKPIKTKHSRGSGNNVQTYTAINESGFTYSQVNHFLGSLRTSAHAKTLGLTQPH